MKRCRKCKTLVLFGGKKEGERQYCGKKCCDRDAVGKAAEKVPQQEVERIALALHRSNCPKCGRQGPVDVHTSYKVWSIVFLTSWSEPTQLSCRRCAVKEKAFGVVFSGLLGWWGIPFGLIITPIQLGRNIWGIFFAPDPNTPSKRLLENARTIGGEQAVAAVLRSQGQPNANSAIGRAEPNVIEPSLR